MHHEEITADAAGARPFLQHGCEVRVFATEEAFPAKAAEILLRPAEHAAGRRIGCYDVIGRVCKENAKGAILEQNPVALFRLTQSIPLLVCGKLTLL
jgi:hypothetical protein